MVPDVSTKKKPGACARPSNRQMVVGVRFGLRSDSAFAESWTVPSSRGTGCSPSSLYAFLELPRLGSVLPYLHSGP